MRSQGKWWSWGGNAVKDDANNEPLLQDEEHPLSAALQVGYWRVVCFWVCVAGRDAALYAWRGDDHQLGSLLMAELMKHV